MIDDLELNKICKEDIFCSDFEELKRDNKIKFPKEGIAILYAPNGVGKTSLVDILDNEKGTELEVICCVAPPYKNIHDIIKFLANLENNIEFIYDLS